MCAPKDTLESDETESQQDMSTTTSSSSSTLTNHRGPLIGAASLGLVIVASSLAMPHYMTQRDKVGCEAFCQGSMASLRSACSLTGAVLTGKWSDSRAWGARYGGARRLSLWAGILGAAISMHLSLAATSVDALLYSVIPSALLQQNLSVLKAVVSEYPAATDGERAAAQGMLGMAAGLAMMVGPVLGATLFPTHQSATNAGYLSLLIAAILIASLPVSETKSAVSAKNSVKLGFLSFLDVPSARSTPAIFLLTCRVLSTLSFHIFQTIWMVALKNRFQFQSSQYGRFMSMVGLFLALSQGSARFVLDFFCRKGSVHAQRNRVRLLAFCFFLVGLARFLAFQIDNLTAIYVLFAIMVTAMGIATTIMSADSTQVASPDELGSFFGLQAAFENVAGMVGPLIGGVLGSYVHPVKAPMAAVLMLNAVVVALVAFRYDDAVLKCNERREKVD
jgi:MFS family permease